jgi:hypothetical protein
MNFNYKLIENPTDKSKYAILETSTEQIVKIFDGKDFSDARKFLRHLNLGGGFDGWSPSFCVRNISSYINKSRKVKQESV